MSKPPSKSSYVPVVSDVVVRGKAKLRKPERKAATSSDNNNYADALNSRIDELESAIGQNTIGSKSRAYAIREEAISDLPPASKKTKHG